MRGSLQPTPCQLHALEEPDDVALWIGEMGDRGAFGDVHRPHDSFAAEPLDLLQARLHVGHADVEHRVAVASGRGPDAGADVVAQVGDAVVHLVVGIDLPPEGVAEELLQLLRVTARDLHVDEWTAHASSSCVAFGSGPGSPPAAAICSRPKYMSQPAVCACADSSLGR